jgi:hypothetical protein
VFAALRSFLVFASSSLLAISQAHAGQIWDGSGGDNNWNTAGNWNGDVLPTFTNAIMLSQGTTLYFNPTNQAIQNTSGFTAPKPITLSGGAGTANIRFAGNDNKFALSGGVTGQAGIAQTLAITQGASGGDRQRFISAGICASGLPDGSLRDVNRAL